MSIERHPARLKSLVRDRLKSSGFRVLEAQYETLGQLNQMPLEEVDAVLMAPARYFPTRQMDRLLSCQLLQIWSSGYDKFNIDDAWQRGMTVANNHGANAVSVAEHTIMMMLGLSRRMLEMHRRVVSGNWSGNDHGLSSLSLNGKTLGLVGLGNVGRLVATRAEALGMAIRFYDPYVKDSPKSIWLKSSLEELFESVDYLSFHVHLTDDTRNMLNHSNVRLLKRQPFIINVSRAELINQLALMSALEEGLIKGAALDAHYHEPTQPHDGLWRFPNVLVSPHVAGSTYDSYVETIDACILNIQRAISHDAILGTLSAG